VISVELARQLKRAGVTWSPASGDRFMVPDRDLDEELFTVSEMVVEVHDLPGGRLFAFNGTTEWALDSVMQADVVWLPREDQLRVLLGEAFVALRAVSGGYAVDVVERGTQRRYVDADAESAYARALLGVLDTGLRDQEGRARA
jgi:hypothetical protein